MRFNFQSANRNFFISDKQAKYLDYDLLDRILHNVRIDTLRFQGLYHNLLYKKLPLNLRPDIFNTFKPQYDDMKFNSSRFMWKLRNRTIYRDSKAHWLRRSKPLKKEDPETEIKLDQLRNDYTLKILHSDEEFY